MSKAFQQMMCKGRLFTLCWCVPLIMLVCLCAPFSVDQAQYIYDDLGRLSQVIDGQGNVATYTYDASGICCRLRATQVVVL